MATDTMPCQAHEPLMDAYCTRESGHPGCHVQTKPLSEVIWGDTDTRVDDVVRDRQAHEEG